MTKRALVILSALLAAPAVTADDWPQWRGPRRDGVWRETGIVEKLPPKLEFKWRREIGAGYAGPAVAEGRVYVTDRVLDRGEENPENPFSRRAIRGRERVLSLDASTGEILWKHEYPCRYAISHASGPRATPTVRDGKVYAVGAMGHFFCLDAASGDVLWSRNYVDDFGTEINVWGMAAAPLVDGNKVVLLVGGGDDAGVVALDRENGKEIWRTLSLSDPGYAAPVIFEAGGVRQLIVWTPKHLNSLDPETGKVYWQQPFRLQAALSVPTPIFEPREHLLFVTAFYNGPLMMRLDRSSPSASLVWKGKSDSEMKTDGLHAIMCTPVFDNGYIYGVCSYGQLRCLEMRTGKRVWETFDATGHGRWWNAFIIPHEDRYFLANEQGELILARLSPEGYEEIDRVFLIAPTNKAKRRKVVWSHPAFAGKCIYARNDQEIVCADLARK